MIDNFTILSLRYTYFLLLIFQPFDFRFRTLNFYGFIINFMVFYAKLNTANEILIYLFITTFSI